MVLHENNDDIMMARSQLHQQFRTEYRNLQKRELLRQTQPDEISDDQICQALIDNNYDMDLAKQQLRQQLRQQFSDIYEQFDRDGEEKCIELVKCQCPNNTDEKIRRALANNNGDIVSAIMELS